MPNCRSVQSRKKARLTEGTASRLPAEMVTVPQVRTGTRASVMPGARMPQEGDEEVHRPDGRRNAEENHAERIEVDVRAGVELA